MAATKTSSSAGDLSAAVLDEHDDVLRGVFDPPDSRVVAAIGRNKLMVLAVAVLCAAIGVGVGVKRKVTFTASTTVQVGQVNPNSPGFFGYVQSSAALATAFSRAIAAEPVLQAVEHKLKLSASQASGRLSAEPLAETPAFRVVATGPNSDAAVKLANVASEAVISYISKSNNANPESATLLREYREAALHLQHVVVHISHMTRKTTSPEALAAAQAEKASATARLRAVGVAYTSSVSSQAPRSGLVSLLAGATSASNDHHSKIELFGFIGLLLGVIAGCFAAVLSDRWRTRQRLAPGSNGRMREPTRPTST